MHRANNIHMRNIRKPNKYNTRNRQIGKVGNMTVPVTRFKGIYIFILERLNK